MAERGGPTTQSGIHYQNSITALYLGRLLDSRSRSDKERVVEVRVEAPESVDDTVISYADGHREYIQAKENVRVTDTAWEKLWQDFSKQFKKQEFQRGKDRLVLIVGNPQNEHETLKQLSERARTSKDHLEFFSKRLGKKNLTLLERLKPVLDPDLLSDIRLLEFLSHLDVSVWSLEMIDHGFLPNWMPASDIGEKNLFRLLRDRGGEQGRIRGWFTSKTLRESLADEGVHLIVPPDIDIIRQELRKSSSLLRQHKYRFGMSRKHLERGVVNEIFAWILDPPKNERVALLLDHAGMGKTVVMHDLLSQLETADLPVLAIKADQQLSGVTSLNELTPALQLSQDVDEIIGRLTALGLVVILIDQIDALSLSLAHDQKALNTILEFIGRLRLYPNVRVIISCRIFDRNSDPNLKRLDIAREFQIGKLTEEEVKNVLLEIGAKPEYLSETTLDLLRVPLHLDLLVTAFESEQLAAQPDILSGLRSLQDLYQLLWEYVIEMRDPNGPPLYEREEVVHRMTQWMDREQRTVAPSALLKTSETRHLGNAVAWLASAGIIIPGVSGWSFLHQTFFDYCYAKYFVEDQRSLSSEIINSNQGLFVRPQLVQVLTYLRGTDKTTYLRELNLLFQSEKLRFHLRDLLYRWFGAIHDPQDQEFTLARRLLLNPQSDKMLLHAINGNPGWFDRLKNQEISRMLALPDEKLDNEVIPYLASMLEDCQAGVSRLISPYLDRGPQWEKRLTWMFSRVRKWSSIEAAEIYEKLCHKNPEFFYQNLYDVKRLAIQFPIVACRLIRWVLFGALDSYKEKSASGVSIYLMTELQSIRDSTWKEILEVVVQTEPAVFVDSMLPWIEDVVSLRNQSKEDISYFLSDDLSADWYTGIFQIITDFVWAFIHALTILGKVSSEKLLRIIANLAALPYRTPQQIVSIVYTNLPEEYASNAFHFIIGDQRRLNLGEPQQFISRNLVSAIFPYLKDSEREELENYIMHFSPLHKSYGMKALQYFGIEQLCLLQSIPAQYLSSKGARRLQELERKFPGYRASDEHPSTDLTEVGSPIGPDAARKMSDKAWLRAMKKHRGEVENRDDLNWNAIELSRVLSSLVKENPVRFYHFALRISDEVDDVYVRAFIEGLAESTAPSEWLFSVIRRFTSQEGRQIKRTIAWGLEKRVRLGLSPDMMDLLESFIRMPMGEDEKWDDNDGYHLSNASINSDRGSSLYALSRALRFDGNKESMERLWNLLEFISSDPSIVLRAGAIEELRFLLHKDRERAVSLFEKLMDSHPKLVRSFDTQEFLYQCILKYFSRVMKYILSMLADENEQTQQRGAELICIASISPNALVSEEEHKAAMELTDALASGEPILRRGIARIYAHNISDPLAVARIVKFLNDEDKDVRGNVSDFIRQLPGDAIFTHCQFLEDYASSYCLRSGMYQFSKFLWENGLLDPNLSLNIIDKILDNDYPKEEMPWWAGSEDLIRLVLQIYTDPSGDADLRNRAMDAFDRLLAEDSITAQRVLSEWDRR